MREELRRDCAAIWVVDCSPEGHQPEVNTRIFQGVQQPVCIVLAARTPNKDRKRPAKLKFMALPKGHREHVKFAALEKLTLKAADWVDGPSDWRAPFLSEQAGVWAQCLLLEGIFNQDSSGVLGGRTWVIAPDVASLSSRWSRLVAEKDDIHREELFSPTLRDGKPADRHSKKIVASGLTGHEHRSISVATDAGTVIAPVRYAYRSFDRQWLIPDNRLLLSARPKLWEAHSSYQIHMTAIQRAPVTSGPALSLSAEIPDQDHYHGRGGRVYPLWRNAEATVSNVKPTLLAHLGLAYGRTITPDDMMAYIAGVMAHPAFTARFRADLVRPGLRLPITSQAALFERAAALGREVIWLHTYGERMVDENAGRPEGPPRLANDGPTMPREGAIPTTPEDFPNELRYDAAAGRLFVGKGYVENVSKALVDYDVSGMNVLNQWFSYRKKDRRRPIIGDRRPPSPLSAIQPEHWLAEYTSDLLDLLHVLGRLVALEPAQAKVLEDILGATLLEHGQLIAAGALGTTVTAQEAEEN